MAFDPAKLTRLSGPLSFILPEADQSKYWAYRTADDILATVKATGFFPDTSGISGGDIVWVYISDGADMPTYTLTILSMNEI